jgi:hypothetical protein
VAGGAGSRGGGALELLRRREAVESTRLGAWMLVMTAACSGRTPSRRIGAATRWRRSTQAGRAGARVPLGRCRALYSKGGGVREAGRAALKGLADAWPWRARQGKAWRRRRHPGRGGHGQERRAQMGLTRALAGPVAGEGKMGRAFGLGPFRIGFAFLFFFFWIYFQCETISEKQSRNCLKHEKYSENHKNSRKISRDRLRHEQPK